ncbi:GNAT family N-acetyltransferase [Stakelama marina]|uniref:GNAT family N-acetyltransferase n=1 Tax=Stakelama marina TaxID=2826939 RepID=A0A8T4IKE9_9SPHN|nr:GNAT family N-acetyltransferase [Stakelama marina]MBR0553575.1 GNAT family N-acetyltransferase [Stakelama marina]
MSSVRGIVALSAGDATDLGDVNAIMADAFDPRYGEAWTPSQCVGMLALSGIWLTMASVDGQSAGFALARSIMDDGELLLLAVRNDFRRRGVGSALLRSVIREAGARGVTGLHLEVRKGNPAIDLYRREGFRKVGERASYYRGITGQQYDAQTFHRMLTKE